MPTLPQLSDFFDTLREYRHSTTISLLLLYITPFFFPVGWNAVGATWQFVAGLMFFLSLGMIITEDIWPWIKFAFTRKFVDDPEMARLIIETCESKTSVFGDDGPPFKIVRQDLEDFESAKEYCESSLNSENDFSTTEDSIIITENGIRKLKEQF